MTRNMHRRLKVRIYGEERNERVWVPYKTLIGYNIRNCPIIGRVWDQVYCVKEFASKSQAIEETKRQARMRILDLFGNAEESEAE